MNNINDDYNNTENIENHLKNMYFIKMLGCAYQNMVSNTLIFNFSFRKTYEENKKEYYEITKKDNPKKTDAEILENFDLENFATLYHRKTHTFLSFIKNYYNKRLVCDYLNSFVDKVDFKKYYHSMIIKDDEIHLVFKNTRRKKGSEKDTHQIEKSIIEGKYKYIHRENKILQSVNALYDEFINIKMSNKIYLCCGSLHSLYNDELTKKRQNFLYDMVGLDKHYNNNFFNYQPNKFYQNL